MWWLCLTIFAFGYIIHDAEVQKKSERRGKMENSIKTLAVFPDNRFKYGTYVYIGSPDLDVNGMNEFIKKESFVDYIHNKKVKNCFMSMHKYTILIGKDNKPIYAEICRFYPPMFWSRAKVKKILETCFEELYISGERYGKNEEIREGD